MDTDQLDAPIPPVTADLVRALEQAFPPRCASPGGSREHELFYAGQRALVEFLSQWLEDTQSGAYEEFAAHGE